MVLFAPNLWASECERDVARTFFKYVDELKHNRQGINKFFSGENLKNSKEFYDENYYDGIVTGLDKFNDYFEFKISWEVGIIANTFKVLNYRVTGCNNASQLEIYYLNVLGGYQKRVIQYSLHNGKWLIGSQLIAAIAKDDVEGDYLNYSIHSLEMEDCLIDAYLVRDRDQRLIEYYLCFDEIQDPRIIAGE